jgi:hypothetical protein
MTMIYDKNGCSYSGIRIKKGQKKLDYVLELESEDYDVIPFATWETTLSISKKTKKGFTVEFGKECSIDNGMLYLKIVDRKKGK